jgi:hypothetical protein
VKKLCFLAIFWWVCLQPLSINGQGKKKSDNNSPPRITVILPLGAEAGRTTKLTIRGMKLDGAQEVKILDDKGTAKIIGKGKANVPDKNADQVGDTQVEVEVSLKPQLPSEPVQIAVVTPDGETKPHGLLVESAIPVVKEKEPNDGFRQAQEVKLPVVVAGTLERPRDVDVFKFEGKAGQKVILEVRAARQGSPLDSLLFLYGDNGVQIAGNDDMEKSVDSKCEVTLPGNGNYYVVLMDAHDAGSPIHVYWLMMK